MLNFGIVEVSQLGKRLVDSIRRCFGFFALGLAIVAHVDAQQGRCAAVALQPQVDAQRVGEARLRLCVRPREAECGVDQRRL